MRHTHVLRSCTPDRRHLHLHHSIRHQQFGTQLAGTLASSIIVSIAPPGAVGNMSEKAPLIPVATPAERLPRVQRCTRTRAIGRLLTTAAAAGLIYYGMPYGTCFSHHRLRMAQTNNS